MEKNNIEFKYLMNLWKILPGYPTKSDIVYELSVYLLKDGRPNGEFSFQTFNSAFGPDWEKTEHKELLEKMINEGDFEETQKSSAAKRWYKIKNNPYYNRK